MAKLAIKVASTSQSVNIFIQDSSSTTGAGLTGLVFNSSGLTAYYALPKAAAVSITLATLAAITTAYSSGGFKEVDATNMPGWYRLDLPDAAIASGRFVSVHLKGATNMAPLPLEIELTGFDNQSTTDGNLSKLTSLTFTGANKVDASVRDWVGDTIPARTVTGVPKVDVADWLGTAVTAATAGIPDTNAKNINNVSTASVTTINANQGTTQPVNFTGTAGSALVKGDAIDLAGTALTGRDIGASVLLSAGSGTGQLDFTSGVVKANLAQILGTALTETAGLLAGGFKKFFNIASPAATMDHGILTDTTTTATTATNLTNAPTAGDFTATMKTSIGTAVAASAVASVTGNVGGNVVGSVGSLTTNNDKTGYALTSGERNSVADALLDRAAGVETNFTPRQSLRLMLSSVVAKLSGAATTTVTIRDINDTKARITATVDSDGNRTAVTTDVS